MPGVTKTIHCIFLRERDFWVPKAQLGEKGAHEH
jgi:hypothetical protein